MNKQSGKVQWTKAFQGYVSSKCRRFRIEPQESGYRVRVDGQLRTMSFDRIADAKSYIAKLATARENA